MTKESNKELAKVSNESQVNADTCIISVETGSPSLPPGKLYHVFFSHCNEDRQWVKEVVDKLELPEYGFKCCYADRDFDLGIPVFQNITKCIHTSKRTIIVMSPEFLQSPWCSYETRITLELDLDTRQRLLIPVMLRNCEPPEYIGRLTYMEVENEHFWERFLTALREDDSYSSNVHANIGSLGFMTGNPYQFNPNFSNTDEIVEVTVYRGCDFCSPSPAGFMPSALMRNGLQVTMGEYREMVATITSILYIRCHGFFSKNIYAFFIPSAVFLLLFFGIFYLAVPWNYRPRILLFGFIALASLIFIMVQIVVYSLSTLIAKRSVPPVLEAANRIAHTRNLMVAVRDYGWCSCTCDKMAVIFYYYDWKPCHTHLMQFLIEQSGTINEETHRERDMLEYASLAESRDKDSTSLQSETWDLLVKHSTEYCQLLLNRRSVTPSEQRHIRQGECLCQFVESILVSGETSCCDCIFGVRSRHPWRRYCAF